jgi:hypothetical protein
MMLLLPVLLLLLMVEGEEAVGGRWCSGPTMWQWL